MGVVALPRPSSSGVPSHAISPRRRLDHRRCRHRCDRMRERQLVVVELIAAIQGGVRGRGPRADVRTASCAARAPSWTARASSSARGLWTSDMQYRLALASTSEGTRSAPSAVADSCYSREDRAREVCLRTVSTPGGTIRSAPRRERDVGAVGLSGGERVMEDPRALGELPSNLLETTRIPGKACWPATHRRLVLGAQG